MMKFLITVIIAATAGENGYTCEHCSKAFNRRSRLIMHVKYVHEGAKPYECEQCTKTFVRKEDLARHAVLHTGIKGGNAVVLYLTPSLRAVLLHEHEPAGHTTSLVLSGTINIKFTCLGINYERKCNNAILKKSAIKTVPVMQLVCR